MNQYVNNKFGCEAQLFENRRTSNFIEKICKTRRN